MTRILTRRSRQTRLRSDASASGVVFGTDFSKNAHQSGLAAAAIAKRFGVPLTLVHAIEFPTIGADSTAKALRWLTASRQIVLSKEADRLRRRGTKIETRMSAGRPDEVLVDLSGAEAPRLLMVSSLGRRSMERWVLGSVAERTAERAPVPTLVLRGPKPWVDWAKGERTLKVFVCFNHTLTSENALRWVKELAAAGPCEITIGWVSWPAEDWSRRGGSGGVSLTDNPPEVQPMMERDLKAKVTELLAGVPFRVQVEANWGRADDCLVEMAKREKADLIVVGSHQYKGFDRLWHASISRGLLYRAPMSVAVVPYATGKQRQTTLAPPVRRVLVPTDLSELANAAIPHAYSLLRGGGSVHFLHVLPPAVGLPTGLQEPFVDPRDSKADEPSTAASSMALRALVPVEAEAQGISTHLHVAKGRDVAATICQHAERLGVDVICLGSHGRSGLSGMLLGSVAQEVMARSRRPLFIIRPPAT